MLTLHNSTNAIVKKIFTVQIVALASISTLVVSSSSSAWGQSQLIALRQCKNVDGKVMSPGDRYESIETLKARVVTGSKNPEIYRVLADRYLEAGLPNEALSEYTTAKKLAKSNKNLKELSKVQEGLKLWEFITNYQRARTGPSSNDERI